MTREEAIKILTETQVFYFAQYGKEKTQEALDMAIDALRAEPVKHGEWIDVVNEPYCECSVCGIYIHNLDDDYKFCPRCGAKMDKS